MARNREQETSPITSCRSRRVLLSAALALIVGTGGCAEEQSSAENPEPVRVDTAYASAQELLIAVQTQGVRCDDLQVLDATAAMSTIASCESDFGHLTAYTFSSEDQQSQWHQTLSLVCGNPIGDEYVRGDGWAIAANDSPAAAGELASALGVNVASFCDP